MKIWLKVSALLFLAGLFSASTPFAHAQIPTTTQSFQGSLLQLVNTDRAANAVPTLVENPLLSLAAQEKADDMAAQGYFSHVSPSGVSPWYWFTNVGYYYTHAGENLAMNFSSPQGVEAAWMASPEHRANILRGIYSQIGIGIAHGTYLGRPTTFIVELFATPAKTNPA